jgi:predicted transcriptional regulator
MPRSKCLAYNDEELRILLCIAGYGPLSTTDLSRATGIRMGNLSTEIKNLLSRDVLKKDSAQMKSRRRGRPRVYLALDSPWVMQTIRDELEYREKQYEIEMNQLDGVINNEFWVDWDRIASDKSKHQDFLNEYGELVIRRLNLGAKADLFSNKSIRENVDGESILERQQRDGIRNSLRKISYPGIRFWLQVLQNPTLRVLGFFMDNPIEDYSLDEIEEAVCMEYNDTSSALLELEKKQELIATMRGGTKTYRLNLRNQSIEKQMHAGLRKITYENLSRAS